MEYVYTHFPLQEKECINKSFITSEDIHQYQKQSYTQQTRDFLSEISNSIIKKKTNSASTYQDIKITGFSPIEYEKKLHKLGVEIKFVLHDTQNDNGMSFHGIYDLTKRIMELSRLEGYISRKDIQQYVDVFFQNLDQSLKTVEKTRPQWFSEVFWEQEMQRREKKAQENGKKFSPERAKKDIQKEWNNIQNP